jgi:hypothetical protein
MNDIFQLYKHRLISFNRFTPASYVNKQDVHMVAVFDQANNRYYLGSFKYYEDTTTGVIWFFDVKVRNMNHNHISLICYWLGHLHDGYYYAINADMPGKVRKSGVMVYGIVEDFEDIPLHQQEPFKGDVIYVARDRALLETAEPKATKAFGSSGVDTNQVTLVIHDPINDDKLTALLNDAEKRFRMSWAKNLKSKYDLETHQEEVEMIICQLVDNWNEDQY